MSAVVEDTHAVVWYLQASKKMSDAGRAALDAATTSGTPIPHIGHHGDLVGGGRKA